MSDLLPNNALPSERAMADAVSRLSDVPVPVSCVWNPDTCPAQVLPWLAWAVSVDEWDSGWTEERKRDVIRESLYVHRIKGTRAAIRRAVEVAGYGTPTITERFGLEVHDGAESYDGSAFYGDTDHWAVYRVDVRRPISNSQAAVVRQILKGVAPVRCQLGELTYSHAQNLYDGTVAYDGEFNHGVV